MTDKKKKKIRRILIGVAVFAGGILYAVFGLQGQDMLTIEQAELPAESSTFDDETETVSTEAQEIYVHVSGAVQQADRVYGLPAGSRVEDAVEAAGGARTDAALWRINLAAPLSDGQRIYIPSEEESDLPDTVISQIIIEESSGSHLTDLNKASKIELEELPGIGPALADRIIAYREEHGGFSDIEEMLAVKGIGDILFSRMKTLITVSGPEA